MKFGERKLSKMLATFLQFLHNNIIINDYQSACGIGGHVLDMTQDCCYDFVIACVGLYCN